MRNISIYSSVKPKSVAQINAIEAASHQALGCYSQSWLRYVSLVIETAFYDRQAREWVFTGIIDYEERGPYNSWQVYSSCAWGMRISAAQAKIFQADKQSGLSLIRGE